jgi:hypothetical protein
MHSRQGFPEPPLEDKDIHGKTTRLTKASLRITAKNNNDKQRDPGRLRMKL